MNDGMPLGVDLSIKDKQAIRKPMSIDTHFYDPKYQSISDPKFKAIEIVKIEPLPSNINSYYTNIFSKLGISKSTIDKISNNVSLYAVPPGKFILNDFMFIGMIAKRYEANHGIIVDFDKLSYLYLDDEYGERVLVFIFEK